MYSHTIFPLTTLLLLTLSTSPISFNNHHAAVALAIPIPSSSPQNHGQTTPALARREVVRSHWDDDSSMSDGRSEEPEEEDIFQEFFRNRSAHWDANYHKDRSLWGYPSKKAYMEDVTKAAKLTGWRPRTRKRQRKSSSETTTQTGTSSEAAGTQQQQVKERSSGGNSGDGTNTATTRKDDNSMKMKFDNSMPWLSNLGKSLRETESRIISNLIKISTPPTGSSTIGNNGLGGGVPGAINRIPSRIMIAP